MSRISTFYGIVITMYYDDHNPPHFHAAYERHQAVIAIGTREVLHGAIPARALRLVRAWALLRERELVTNWELHVRRRLFDRLRHFGSLTR